MNQADDQTFIRRFSGIIVGLVIFTVLIIVLAINFQNEPDPTADNPSQARLAEERIAPVASVRTGDDAAQPEVNEESTPEVAASSAPFDGSLDGKLIYDNVCAACHNTGVADAPIPGGTMNERADKGLETLVTNAINGLNVMPPRGGNSDLTDEQVRASVEYMLNP